MPKLSEEFLHGYMHSRVVHNDLQHRVSAALKALEEEPQRRYYYEREAMGVRIAELEATLADYRERDDIHMKENKEGRDRITELEASEGICCVESGCPRYRER